MARIERMVGHVLLTGERVELWPGLDDETTQPGFTAHVDPRLHR